MTRAEQDEDGNRTWTSDEWNGKRHEKGIVCTLQIIVTSVSWKYHTQCDQEEKYPAGNVERGLAEIQETEYGVSCEEEAQQYAQGKTQLSSDNDRAPAAPRFGQHRLENRNVSQGAHDEEERHVNRGYAGSVHSNYRARLVWSVGTGICTANSLIDPVLL